MTRLAERRRLRRRYELKAGAQRVANMLLPYGRWAASCPGAPTRCGAKSCAPGPLPLQAPEPVRSPPTGHSPFTCERSTPAGSALLPGFPVVQFRGRVMQSYVSPLEQARRTFHEHARTCRQCAGETAVCQAGKLLRRTYNNLLRASGTTDNDVSGRPSTRALEKPQ